MPPKVRTAEGIIARLASLSHGVVTRAELLAAGVTPAEIRHRIAAGSLIRVHRGVFRVGHWAPSLEASYMAAVKACGRRAVLSGTAAGFLLELLRWREAPAAEVSVAADRRVRGVAVRRIRPLRPGELSTHRAIPVTSVPRTLVDLARVLDADSLARAYHEAWVKYRTTPEQIEAVLLLRPNAPGARKLRSVLWGDRKLSLSRLEKRFVELVGAAGLVLPETNRIVDKRYVDCRWTEPPLTVELDSYQFHSSRHAWEQDRRREREARARGDDFRRFTWGDVFEYPRPMLRELASVLPRRADY